MKVTALLPIKANSERVPGKNFRPLAGKPLYRWVLDTLLTVDQVDRVVINTDSEALLTNADLARDDRIHVRERPLAIRGDMVSMNRIIEDDLRCVEGEWFLQTHATNPLLRAATISSALHSLEQSRVHDSLFTVTRWQTRFYWGNGRPVNHDPQELLRTQDLPPLYEENSNLYIFSRNSFGQRGERIGMNPLMFPMPAKEAVDIDDEDSWAIASSLMEVQTSRSL